MTTPPFNSRRSSRTSSSEYVRKEVSRFSLEGTPIFERYITSSADKKRELVLRLLDGTEISGYGLGLDDDWLQILVLETREQIMIAIPNILTASHGRTYYELDEDQKNTVDNFTSSFRGASVAFLKRAWPSGGEIDDSSPTPERQR